MTNPSRNNLAYWNKNIAIIDDRVMDPALGPVTIGNNQYYGRKIHAKEKTGLFVTRILPLLFISVVLAPVSIPLIYTFTDKYRDLGRWGREIKYGRKLKCINNVAGQKLNSNKSEIPPKSSKHSSHSKKTKEEFLQFIEDNAGQLVSIDLREYKVTDQDIERVVKASPNIDALMLNSSEITEQAFHHINQLKNLKFLSLSGLEVSDFLLDGLVNLEKLIVTHSPNLKTLPNLDHLKELRELEILFNVNLEVIPSLDHLSKLENLKIHFSRKLDSIPSLNSLVNLKKLVISKTAVLEYVPPLDNLLNLRELKIKNNNGLITISSIKLPNLHSLVISDNPELQFIPDLDVTKDLDELIICNNKSLQLLPKFAFFAHVNKVEIKDNNDLPNLISKLDYCRYYIETS